MHVIETGGGTDGLPAQLASPIVRGAHVQFRAERAPITKWTVGDMPSPGSLRGDCGELFKRPMP